MNVVDTVLAALADRRILSWSPCWPYLTGDGALVAEAHTWLADRSRVAVTPTGPFVEATLAVRREPPEDAPVAQVLA